MAEMLQNVDSVAELREYLARVEGDQAQINAIMAGPRPLQTLAATLGRRTVTHRDFVAMQAEYAENIKTLRANLAMLEATTRAFDVARTWLDNVQTGGPIAKIKGRARATGVPRGGVHLPTLWHIARMRGARRTARGRRGVPPAHALVCRRDCGRDCEAGRRARGRRRRV